MTDQELEQRLREALARTAPDDAAAVLARCGAKQGKVIPMREARPSAPKKRRPWRGLVAACLALALLGGGGGIFYQRAYAVASVVSLDVNPSIEMRVNRQEKVLSCTALNQDAAAVLADMGGGRDLEGAKLDVAVNAVVGALVRGGYLDQLDSAILISVEDSDTARAARLQQELESSVGGLLQSSASQAAVMGQSLAADAVLDAQAQRNSISTGRAYLVEQVVAMNGSLDFNALAALSVEELRDMLQIGAPGMPVGKAAAQSAALAYAGVDGSARVEVDAELDEPTPCYEVELEMGGREYEYRVDAYTGQVLSGQQNIGQSGGSGATAAPGGYLSDDDLDDDDNDDWNDPDNDDDNDWDDDDDDDWDDDDDDRDDHDDDDDDDDDD